MKCLIHRKKHLYLRFLCAGIFQSCDSTLTVGILFHRDVPIFVSVTLLILCTYLLYVPAS